MRQVLPLILPSEAQVHLGLAGVWCVHSLVLVLSAQFRAAHFVNQICRQTSLCNASETSPLINLLSYSHMWKFWNM